MSGAKHTSGTWMAAASPSSVVGWPVVGQMGRSICNVSWMPKMTYPDVSEADYAAFSSECEANARLIAAAPDLLAALQAARKWLVVNDDSRCQSDLKAVEVAIAKAEGRAP